MEKQIAIEKRKELDEQGKQFKRNMNLIKHTDGASKSTMAANLTIAFAVHGFGDHVGILNVDILGPCIPKLLGGRD